MFKYELLARVARAAVRQEAQLVAFGLNSDELRLVIEGDDADIVNLMRGVKVGTARATSQFNIEVSWGCTDRYVIQPGQLTEAVVWCHDVGRLDPLASPWTSHRDLMGFRSARFFNADGLRARVTATQVHELAGGRPLPKGWPPANRQESLNMLLRVSAAVLGVLPADRKCFRLFVHLARSRGWGTRRCAEALALTDRRIRQLASAAEPMITTALTALGDPRLCVVP